MIKCQEGIIEMYIDYINNFITIYEFADYYSIPRSQSSDVLAYGRFLNDNFA